MTHRRYFVLDPGFEDFDSHHCVVADILVSRAKVSNIEVLVFASKKVGTYTQKDEEKVVPFFTTPCYTNNLYPLPCEKENLLAEGFQRELDRLFRQYSVNQCDVLVMHTAFSHLFLGLAKFLSGVEKHRAPKLIICGMFDPGSQSINDKNELFRYTWFTKNKLSLTYLEQSLVSENLLFATSCKEYQQEYQQMLRTPVAVHPAINYLAPSNANREHKCKKRLLLYVGSVKRDKGVNFTFNNLPYVLEQFSDIEFVVHWNTNSPGLRDFDNVEPELRELLRKFNNLEVMFGTLSKEKYESLFDSVQGVVTSYAPESYRYKTSGIFWDVLRRVDCDLISTKDTWLERESLKLQEPTYFFDYGNIDSMISAISKWESRDATVVRNASTYKNLICRPFSEWIFSQFEKVE